MMRTPQEGGREWKGKERPRERGTAAGSLKLSAKPS